MGKFGKKLRNQPKENTPNAKISGNQKPSAQTVMDNNLAS
jgi:hypothetical protein